MPPPPSFGAVAPPSPAYGLWSADMAGAPTRALVSHGKGIQCTILDGTFDYVVQLLLGLIAFASLVVKWKYFEGGEASTSPTAETGGAIAEGNPNRPDVEQATSSGTAQTKRVRISAPPLSRRSPLIFLLDSSKQCGGFLVAHLGNILTSQWMTNHEESACMWYFMNIAFDTTVRVAIAYALLTGVMWAVTKLQIDRCGHLISGEYGTPVSYVRWLKQFVLWLFIVALSRSLMAVLVFLLREPIGDVGAFLLWPLEQYSARNGHNLELILVMVVFPTLLNIFQLWVQDAFLKRQVEEGEAVGEADQSAKPKPGKLSSALWSCFDLLSECGAWVFHCCCGGMGLFGARDGTEIDESLRAQLTINEYYSNTINLPPPSNPSHTRVTKTTTTGGSSSSDSSSATTCSDNGPRVGATLQMATAEEASLL